MNDKITRKQIIARLHENQMPFGEMQLDNGVSVILSQWGGRVFGPFFEASGESLLWMNGAFKSAAAFQEVIQGGEWNLGGDRIWIGPELQYNVQDRKDFWNTYIVPSEIDPGRYQLTRIGETAWRLAQDFTLPVYEAPQQEKALLLESQFRPVEDPLRNLKRYPELMDGITYAGYEQVTRLQEVESDQMMSQVWNLVQVNPGGTLLIPSLPPAEITDYYDPVDDQIRTVYRDHIRLKITGDRLYKVGVKSAHVLGRLGYLNRLEDGRAYLLVRNFFNNPSAPYPDEPYWSSGGRGDAVHIFNDDGGYGGYGELECQGQAIGGDTGRSESTDPFTLWFYVGLEVKIKALIPHLLGPTVE